METNYVVGRRAAYAGDVAFVRHEPAWALEKAKRVLSLDWAARLMFHVAWAGEDRYTTDPVAVMHLTHDHPDATVRVLPVRQ